MTVSFANASVRAAALLSQWRSSSSRFKSTSPRRGLYVHMDGAGASKTSCAG